jgi:hypothetical protein
MKEDFFKTQLERERAILEKGPNFVYDNIRPALFNGRLCKEINSEVMGRVFDMVCVLYVTVNETTCVITERMWRILKLTGKKEFNSFKSMYELALTHFKDEEVLMHPEGNDHSGPIEMHTVMSTECIFGTAFMLSRKMLKKFARMMECESYYISTDGITNLMLFPIARQNVVMDLRPENIHHVAMQVMDKKKMDIEKVTKHVFKYDVNTNKVTKVL